MNASPVTPSSGQSRPRLPEAAQHHGDAGLAFGRIGFGQLLESAADARHAMVALLRTAEAAG
jgi:hypothetical protein